MLVQIYWIIHEILVGFNGIVDHFLQLELVLIKLIRCSLESFF